MQSRKLPTFRQRSMLTGISQNPWHMTTKRNHLLVFILTFGVFSILNTEMGVIGILPLIAENYEVSISTAGLIVSLFALAVAICWPILPLLFSGMNRKHVMLFVLGIFIVGSRSPPSHQTLRYWSLHVSFRLFSILSIAHWHLRSQRRQSPRKKRPKAVAKVFVGVSAGMVLGVPLSSLIATSTSLFYAMLFFAAVTIVAFVATLLFVPSMPVTKESLWVLICMY